MASNSNKIDPRNLELVNKGIVKDTSKLTSGIDDVVLDSDWVKRAFLVPNADIQETSDMANRFWSSASYKFTDTRLGANLGINAKPQFTRYSDIRVKGRLAGRNDVSTTHTTGNYGMGRYYSEAIDDPAQRVWMTFGVPQFNGVANFISKAFDANMTSIARTGRAPSAFYTLAKAAGTAATIIAAPPIALGIILGKVVGSFFLRDASKFYTLKPTMHNYWSTVNVLANTIAINKGIMPKILKENQDRLAKPFELDTEYLDFMSKLLPDTFRGGTYFDIYAMANKAQRISNKLVSEDFERLNNGTATDFTGYLKKNLTGDGTHATFISDDNNEPTLAARFDELSKFADYSLDDSAKINTEQDPRVGADGKQITEPGFFSEFKEDFDSEMRDGTRFATFIVEHTGSVSESFGSSAAESDLSSKINSVASSARQARFAFGEGNTGVDLIDGALGAVGDVVSGGLSGVTLGFSDMFASLSGSGYIDIPKYWQSSTASFPKSSYTMKLISPYNNVISQMQNIFIPLSMILAGALPLSTGKASYGSPFLCQLFDRGRNQIQLGMIESLSITRGTANLPFDIQGKALAIDVSFTVADLSSIMHMPVSTGSIFGTDMTLDETNKLSEYLAVIAGQDIYSQIYAIPKARLSIAKKIMQTKKLTSPAFWASTFHESTTNGLLEKLTFGAFDAIKLASRNTTTIG